MGGVYDTIACMKEVDGIGVKATKGWGRKDGGTQRGLELILYLGKESESFKMTRKTARDLMRAIYRAIGTRTYGPP